MTAYPETDPFWVESRAKFLAAKSTSADPSACGTCRDLAAEGKPVKHDECQQRATILQAPDHPNYELLAGFSLEENAELPARFHVPVFDDLGKSNAWLCAVCWEDGTVSQWPCATAQKYGTKVFTPLHEAETEQRKQAAETARLREELSAYEVMNPQQCPAGKHADWLVDSEYTHACPWCQIDELKQQAERPADAVEYGVRVPGSVWPEDGVLLDGDALDRADQEARLERYRDSWPNAELVQRSVHRGEWTEATS